MVHHRTLRVPRALRLLVAAGLLLSLTACDALATGPDEADTASTTTSPVTTTLPPGQLTPIESIQSGQCLNEVEDETAQSFLVAVIECSDPHTFEVFDVQKFGGDQSPRAGAEYPGDLVVANAAETQCSIGFAAFMGIEWEASDFDIRTWWPTQQSWNQRNDRTILCAVYKVTGETQVGSVRGSAL